MNLRPLPLCLLLAACGGAPLSGPPPFTPVTPSLETLAMAAPAPPEAFMPEVRRASASLWTSDRGSLLSDDRAVARGDILTVVIEIDDSAQISNSTDASRDGSTSMEVGALFGVPEILENALPDGAAAGVELGGESDFSGDGSVRRAEELTLRVAATVTDILPNGVLAIAGSQEVRVNNELRELLVSGFVRPADVSRQNEVAYDRIAQARISYGGRGLISEAQAPRVGQAALDRLLPF